MDRFGEMEAFAMVVDHGSFTGAARKLGVSKSAVSKRVSALENRLGARLLDRTTRQVSLTFVGTVYYDRAKRILCDARDADALVSSLMAAPRGTLKIAAPREFAALELIPRVTPFLNQYPEIKLDFLIDDSTASDLETRVDIAITVSKTSHPHETPDRENTSRLGQSEWKLVAAPSYVEQHSPPPVLNNLQDYTLLIDDKCSIPEFQHQGHSLRQSRNQFSTQHLVTDDFFVLLNAAISGAGIAYIPSYMCKQAILRDELVALTSHLPLALDVIEIRHDPVEQIAPKLSIFIDFLKHSFEADPL